MKIIDTGITLTNRQVYTQIQKWRISDALLLRILEKILGENNQYNSLM